MTATRNAATPREVETATGLNTRQRCAVDRRLGKAGYRLKHRRNPERADKSDRLTVCLYWLEV
jgi:hypothetical protein